MKPESADDDTGERPAQLQWTRKSCASADSMIYAALSLWLVAIVLMAWAVHDLWGAITKPKAVNIALLPGTLVAQLGRIVGLLVTGAKVTNTALMGDGEDGDPTTEPRYEAKLPVFGPVVVGLLPLIAAGIMTYVVLIGLGKPVVAAAYQAGSPLSPNLVLRDFPADPSAFWDQLRNLVTLAQGTLEAVLRAEMAPWRIAAFAYLMICMTVRMAPFAGNIRGHLGAIASTGGILALAGTLSPTPAQSIERLWPLISLTVGWLFLLLIISLVVHGAVTTVRMIARWQ